MISPTLMQGLSVLSASPTSPYPRASDSCNVGTESPGPEGSNGGTSGSGYGKRKPERANDSLIFSQPVLSDFMPH